MGILWIGGRRSRFGSTNVIVDYSRIASIWWIRVHCVATSLPGKSAPFHSFPPPPLLRAKSLRREARCVIVVDPGSNKDVHHRPATRRMRAAGICATTACATVPRNRHAALRWVSTRACAGPLASPAALRGSTGCCVATVRQHGPATRGRHRGDGHLGLPGETQLPDAPCSTSLAGIAIPPVASWRKSGTQP